MAVQTSSITTAASSGTNLFFIPDGVGQVTISTLAGAGSVPMGIDNTGELYHFLISDLNVATTVAGTDLVMMQVGATGLKQVSAQNLVNGTDAIKLTNLSVTQLTATGAGKLVYNNATGVFTYTPPTRQGLGAIALTDLSVVTAATATITGALTYNNANGVFTYTPVKGAEAATNAEQRAGTLNTKFSSPQTSVAKDASGVTGAILLSGGTTAQRPTAARGMQRYNTSRGNVEWYDTFWQALQNELVPTVRSANYTTGADEVITVTSAGKTITLPANPEPGDNLCVVVAGDFLDTIVARNGNNIMELAEDITLDKQYAAMTFTYMNAAHGWRLN